MEWQPIETAPRNGASVLIYMPEASRQKVREASWATPWDGAPLVIKEPREVFLFFFCCHLFLIS